MKSPLSCKKCGTKNDIGRIYCVKCGERLDLKGFRPGREREGIGSDLMHGLKRTIRLVLLTALLALLVGFLWPTGPRGQEGDLEQAERLYERVLDFEQSIRRGEPDRMTVREEAINAYLKAIIRRMDESAAGEPYHLKTESVNLSFTSEDVIVHILASWGPARLSYEITGIPRADERGATLDIHRVRLGHVPMPEPVMDRLAQRVGRIFTELERERFILLHVSRVEIREGMLRLTADGGE